MTKRLFFAKAGSCVFALDQIAHVDFSAIEELKVRGVLKDGTAFEALDIEALELAMQVKPSVVEGKKLAYARRAWWVHNLLGHPVMQVLAWFGAYAWAFRVHDDTVPTPVGVHTARTGSSNRK